MTALDVRVRQGLDTAGVPKELVDELLQTFVEAKQRFYRDDLRPSEIEGGRFSEAVFRILEWAAFGSYTSLGMTLTKVPALVTKLENATNATDSVRFHIPRTLRVIYDLRNKRDVAHLGDGIDPNQQDATLVVRSMEWVLAELVRLYHSVSPDEAHEMIVDLVSKEVPLIQVLDGYPRILTDLKAQEHLLVLLYWRGAEGATRDQLKGWLRADAARNKIGRDLTALDNKHLVHPTANTGIYVLTHLGIRSVEDRQLLSPL